MLKRFALLSVTDKTDIASFATFLAECGYGLLSTGGTYNVLTAAGVEAQKVEDYTATPEMFQGRLKILHPKIFGGLLARKSDEQELMRLGWDRIAVVVVNLYAFAKTVASGCTEAEVIEKIDVGGPSALRAAVKNHPTTLVVPSSGDYKLVLENMKADGATSLAFRKSQAAKTMQILLQDTQAIAKYTEGWILP